MAAREEAMMNTAIMRGMDDDDDDGGDAEATLHEAMRFSRSIALLVCVKNLAHFENSVLLQIH